MLPTVNMVSVTINHCDIASSSAALHTNMPTHIISHVCRNSTASDAIVSNVSMVNVTINHFDVSISTSHAKCLWRVAPSTILPTVNMVSDTINHCDIESSTTALHTNMATHIIGHVGGRY